MGVLLQLLTALLLTLVARCTARLQIIDGDEAERGQFPWQAAVLTDKAFFCGASLISESWLLTAGHCVKGFSTFDVTLGATDLGVEEPGSLRLTSIVSVLHEEYDPKTLLNDVGLISLGVSLSFTEFLSPVRLPSTTRTGYMLVGSTVTVSGWGSTSDGGAERTDVLRYTDVLCITNVQCAKTFGKVITESNVCTSGPQGRTPCKGDSGGPLVLQEADGRYTLVGVVSFGAKNGCSRYPAVYTRVTAYLEWMEKWTGVGGVA